MSNATTTQKAVTENVNVHAVPRIVYAVVNVGVGKRRDDKTFLQAVEDGVMQLTGQRPHARVARRAVSGFSVREGNLVGYRVTLRGRRMEDFVQRLVRMALPRVRDFRGLSPKSLDEYGSLNIGITEHLAFPEINPDKTDETFGLQVTLVTSTRTREDGERLFRSLGFPLIEDEDES